MLSQFFKCVSFNIYTSDFCLTDMHGITTDDNWKKFARALHFSATDIRLKFSKSKDPFAAIISQYRMRGGSHEDFLQTLNQVSGFTKEFTAFFYQLKWLTSALYSYFFLSTL